MLVLIIDNYDSFTYNLVNELSRHGARCIVVRNDEILLSGVERINPDRIIISPGPGDPRDPGDVGVSLDVVKRLGRRTPILGVCLGHQVVGLAYGCRVRPARRVLHGKRSLVKHFGGGLYRGVPSVFKAMRYHSLVVDSVNPPLRVESVSAGDGEVMGLRHEEHPVHGVQFHPESVGTDEGPLILKNFLDDPW